WGFFPFDSGATLEAKSGVVRQLGTAVFTRNHRVPQRPASRRARLSIQPRFQISIGTRRRPLADVRLEIRKRPNTLQYGTSRDSLAVRTKGRRKNRDKSTHSG